MFASLRLATSSFGLVLIAFVISTSSVAAASWQPQVHLTTSGAGFIWQYGLATTGNGAVLAAYRDSGDDGYYHAYLRRSTDGGQTWTKGKPLSTACTSGGPAIDAHDNTVDGVWIETPNCNRPEHRRIAYRRSNDGGKTFGSTKTMAWVGRSSSSAVARGTDGTVVVAWTDGNTAKIYTRTSLDGGATFKPVRQVATTTNHPYETSPDAVDGIVRIAIGSGVAYLGYYADQETLVVRRSTNGGASWSAAEQLTGITDGYSDWSLAAEGTHAIAAFSTFGTMEWTQYRRTTDSGLSWSPAADLSPHSGKDSSYPNVALHDGTLVVAYHRVTRAGSAVFYREGPEGGALSSAAQVSPTSNSQDAWPAGLAAVGDKILVGYSAQLRSGDSDAFVRSK